MRSASTTACPTSPWSSVGAIAGAEVGRDASAAGEAARLVETLARAMQAAHDQHVVHRDLKPANVLLRRTARPR